MRGNQMHNKGGLNMGLRREVPETWIADVARTFEALRLATEEQRDRFRSMARGGQTNQHRGVTYVVRLSNSSEPFDEEASNAQLEGAS